MQLNEKQVVRIAGFELNALSLAKVLPEPLEGARIEEAGTLIHDIDGEPLFRRVPLERQRRSVGYADVAVSDIFAEPLLAIDFDTRWSESAMLRRATAALREHERDARFDETRLVAYSYPKLAVQFLLQGREVAMLELFTWARVPPDRGGDEKEEYGFQRRSLKKHTGDETRRANAESFEKRVAHWERAELRQIDPARISVATLQAVDFRLLLSDTREIHYAPRTADHHICYELRGQQTGVWCVAASVEMILNFYRWRYDQPRIADELDLGTCTNPNGLPYGDEIEVVNTLERLSANSLDADMDATPDWALFRDEIREHRPLISFIPHHSRTVAGYTEARISLLGELPYRGLLVYDPWPPTDCDHPEAGGTITRWENFRTQTYRHAFRARLKHV